MLRSRDHFANPDRLRSTRPWGFAGGRSTGNNPFKTCHSASVRSPDSKLPSRIGSLESIPDSCVKRICPRSLALPWQIFFTSRAVEASTAMRASLKRSKEVLHDGVAHGRQAWLRWRSIDCFFPASLARGDDAEGRHTGSLSCARAGEELHSPHASDAEATQQRNVADAADTAPLLC